MKKSNIFSVILFSFTLIGMVCTNLVLKDEFLKIDLEDTYKNYVSHATEPYSVLHIEGSNGYPIEVHLGTMDDVKVLRSRLKHFSKKRVNDTLFIEFSGSNININQAIENETPPGIIIGKNSLSSIVASHTYNRLSGFSDRCLDIKLRNSAILEISDAKLETLHVLSADNSQFAFSNNNRVDTLSLTMLDESVGRLDEISFSTLNHSLGDSIVLVLSKNTFAHIEG